MKFTCDTKELSNACNNVIRAVSTKVTIPTIEGILIECGSDTLSLTGYDFEFGINTILSVDVVEPGAIVINAKVLCDIIRKLADVDVTVETNGTSVSIIAVPLNIILQVLTQKIIPNSRRLTTVFRLKSAKA